MASFRSKAIFVFFAIAGMVAASLVGVANAADAPAPAPASGTVTMSAPVAAAVLFSTAAFFGALRA